LKAACFKQILRGETRLPRNPPWFYRSWLDRTGATNAGLAVLAKLPSLEVLSLRETAITNASLAQLKSLPWLNMLDLTGTEVTDDGAAGCGFLLTGDFLSHTPEQGDGSRSVRSPTFLPPENLANRRKP